MALNLLFDFGIWLFNFLTSSMPSLAPVVYNVGTTFADLASFGVWVIGSDMFQTICVFVTAWVTFKIIAGTVLFIYKLIPII